MLTKIGAKFGMLLGNGVYIQKVGRVLNSSTGFRLPNGDLLSPDVSFGSRKRLKRNLRAYAGARELYHSHGRVEQIDAALTMPCLWPDWYFPRVFVHPPSLNLAWCSNTWELASKDHSTCLENRTNDQTSTLASRATRASSSQGEPEPSPAPPRPAFLCRRNCSAIQLARVWQKGCWPYSFPHVDDPETGR